MSTLTDHVLFAVPLDFVMFVELDTLGADWPAEIDGRRAQLTFPALPESADSQRTVLDCPPGTPPALAKRVKRWGIIPEKSPVADIHTVLIAVEVSALIEWELEDFPAAGDDISQLSQAVHKWYSSFMHWVYCLTAQSLDTRNPDPKMIHRASSNMIQTVAASNRCTRPAVASAAMPIMVDFTGGPSSERVLPWSLAATATSRAAGEPPANLQLLASARLFMRRHDLRRALIDAGTAAEGAMVQLLGPSAARQTLGALVNLCPTVQIDAKVNLVDPRNDAVHRGITPTWAITGRAIEIVEDLVLQVESDGVAATSLRHVNRPQRSDILTFSPNEKMVELSKNRANQSQQE